MNIFFENNGGRDKEIDFIEDSCIWLCFRMQNTINGTGFHIYRWWDYENKQRIEVFEIVDQPS